MNLQIAVNDATLNSYYTGIPAGKVFKMTLNEVDYYDAGGVTRIIYITCPTLKQYGANNKIFLPLMVGGQGTFYGLNREFYFTADPSTNLDIAVFESTTNQAPGAFGFLHLNFQVEEME